MPRLFEANRKGLIWSTGNNEQFKSSNYPIKKAEIINELDALQANIWLKFKRVVHINVCIWISLVTELF